MQRQIGQQAEMQACEFLQNKGLELITRNYQFGDLGEIDLIMRDKNYVVFIEVRMRSNEDFMTALETINRTKRRKIIRTATYYLMEQGWYDKIPCRFDVIALQNNQIEWIKNAFQ